MLVPIVNVMGGRAARLVEGQRQAVDAGDPRDLVRRFARVGELTVVDLDATLRSGSNDGLLRELLPLGRLRVGGGIRDVATAKGWLDAGAEKVILGTAAEPELLKHLPRERVIAALDARDGEVVVDGWRTGTGKTVVERMKELSGYVGGFLVHFVEMHGLMAGTHLERVQAMVEAAGTARLTVAGGITTADEIAHLDRMGVDAQVGMALHTGRLDLAEAVTAPLTSDRMDGLWPTVVVDEHGVALGLAWSSLQSVQAALDSGEGVFRSRRRGLWRGTEKTGKAQELLRIDLDCDRDSLRFMVRLHGDDFCQNHTHTCFGDLEQGRP
ncbi:MAG TPA: HisA/HisF-related TIM barrel protein [Myxococcota bacterium]|nr:HisA/HisF-related TIM barrel protein [Myxococcota bacterium]